MTDEVYLLDANSLHKSIDMIHDLLVVFIIILFCLGIVSVSLPQPVKGINVKILGEIVIVLLPALGAIASFTSLSSMD